LICFAGCSARIELFSTRFGRWRVVSPISGCSNGLTRTALKCTLPGVPDIYQGTEFWDFSLVDPDNRRPVDYGDRERGLATESRLDSLVASWGDGRIKQALLTGLLADRAKAPTLYADGDYRPIEVTGGMSRHVVPFCALPAMRACSSSCPGLSDGWLRESSPRSARRSGRYGGAGAVGAWLDVLAGGEVDLRADGHPVGELFSTLPISVLRRHP
jgi:(1->4)-alpha-D-glucan 1-alpha-D-glucosylmutase